MDETLEAITEESRTHMTRIGITTTKLSMVYMDLTGLLIKYPELRHTEMLAAMIAFGRAFEESLEAERDVCSDLCALLVHDLTPIANK